MDRVAGIGIIECTQKNPMCFHFPSAFSLNQILIQLTATGARGARTRVLAREPAAVLGSEPGAENGIILN